MAEVIEKVTAILLGIAVPAFLGLLGSLWLRYKALNAGVRSLLRAEIIRCYDKYKDKGCCPVYARDALSQAYKAYHTLGGNGVITGLYDEIMELPADKKDGTELLISSGEGR